MRSKKRPAVLDDSGRPTTFALVRYTEGDCWHLAFELGKALDAPLIALSYADDDDSWCHVAVDLGRESVLDVMGRTTRDEILREWESQMGEPLRIRELGRFHCLDDLLKALGDSGFGLLVSEWDEYAVGAVAHAIASGLYARGGLVPA